MKISAYENRLGYAISRLDEVIAHPFTSTYEDIINACHTIARTFDVHIDDLIIYYHDHYSPFKLSHTQHNTEE